MKQVITIRRKATFVEGLPNRKIGRVVHTTEQISERQNCFVVLTKSSPLFVPDDLIEFGAVLLEEGIEFSSGAGIPVMTGYEELSDLTEGTILAIEPCGGTNTLFRPESDHNVIFTTGQCNNNCIMCSQPPTNEENRIGDQLKLIELIQIQPSSMGISGGEPTLLGENLIQILNALKEKFPNLPLFMLSNGRLLSEAPYAEKIAKALSSKFICGIPLYADVAAIHDYIVQAKGAFEETISGLYNCARYGIPVEIRVVLHKKTLPRLLPLIDFIYRNLPFVRHIALMGLENMGYVKKNWEELWIDPIDYQLELEEAVKRLHYRGMSVSIYNHPLCIIPKTLWNFARQSISDYKNIYLDDCISCSVKNLCGGLFQSSKTAYSRGIREI